ncbi:flagellar FliJ protein [Tamilnaduibacter salinus]|uniref:Flagellar FliJ protein n=1 Tax=Tamilnaduibacter salinus TaxID=1484056 RepID=A0A2A2I6U6_9GAMM|nr:flagellar export protein FliJ [Tamilnaduibacter salinus]PAV27377.1 flagellar export protein FliJ [Tamilnaduibacter salinus]PVY79250.1 flagellar FliJ protein [Tamilnaduibacter salinus]
MTPRSERLQVVLNLEKRREDRALEVLGRARQNLDGQQRQLDELRHYLSDYQQQVRQSQQGAVSVARLQGWQAFIGQLETAIAGQQQSVDEATRQFEKARDQWRQAYERRKGMARHIEACRAEEARADDLREQKQADEAASRLHARRRLS